MLKAHFGEMRKEISGMIVTQRIHKEKAKDTQRKFQSELSVYPPCCLCDTSPTSPKTPPLIQTQRS
jgi:hypothetical protein